MKRKCINIKNINCSENKLHSLVDITNHHKLERFTGHTNKFETKVSFEKNINLREIDIGNNKLSIIRIPLTITNLHIGLSNFESLYRIEQAVYLKELLCDNNKIKSVDNINELKYIECLVCNNNLITHINSPLKLKQLDVDFDVNVNCDVEELNYNYNKKLEGVSYYKIKLNISNMLDENYDEFIQSNYFKEHKYEIVEKYNLVIFYDDIYLIEKQTDKCCLICLDSDFNKYIMCHHGHIICFECYQLLLNKKICDVCRNDYSVKKMYYTKSVNK